MAAPEYIHSDIHKIMTDRLAQCNPDRVFSPSVSKFLSVIAGLVDEFIGQVCQDRLLAINLGLCTPVAGEPFKGYSACIRSQQVIECLARCAFLDRVLWAHDLLIPGQLVQRRHSLTLFRHDQLAYKHTHFIQVIEKLVPAAQAVREVQSSSASFPLDAPSHLTALQASSHKLTVQVQDAFSSLLTAFTGTLWCLEENSGQLFIDLLQNIKDRNGAIRPILVDTILDTFHNFNFTNRKPYIYMWLHTVMCVFAPRFPGSDRDTTLDQVLQRSGIPVGSQSRKLLMAERALTRYYIRLLNSAICQVNDASTSTLMFDPTVSDPTSDFSQLMADLDTAIQLDESDQVLVIEEPFQSRIVGFQTYHVPALRPPSLFYTPNENRDINSNLKRIRGFMADAPSDKRQRLQLGIDGVEVVSEPAELSRQPLSSSSSLPKPNLLRPSTPRDSPTVTSPHISPTPPSPSGPGLSTVSAQVSTLKSKTKGKGKGRRPLKKLTSIRSVKQDKIRKDQQAKKARKGRKITRHPSTTICPQNGTASQDLIILSKGKESVNKQLTDTGTSDRPTDSLQATKDVDKDKKVAKARIRRFMQKGFSLKDYPQLTAALAKVDIVDLTQDDDDAYPRRKKRDNMLGHGDKRDGPETRVTYHDITVWMPFANPEGDVKFEKQTLTVPFTNHSYPFSDLKELLDMCGLCGDKPPETVSFCTVMPKYKFLDLSVSEQRRLWRQGVLHLFSDVRSVPPSSNLGILRELGVNLKQTRSIYENQRATSLEKPMSGMRRGSLLSLFSMPAEDTVDCNVLDIPLPSSPNYLPPKSLRNLSLNQDLRHVFASIDMPDEALQWCLYATAPARTDIHIDAGKFNTWINPQSGIKLWIVQEPSPQVEEVNLNDIDYRAGKWYGVILRPDDDFIMPANTNHIVVTLADSVTMGGHFYSIDNLQRTMIAGMREHFWGDTVTNTAHVKSEGMVYRLAYFLFERMRGADTTSELLGDIETARLAVPPEMESEVYPYLVFMLLHPEKFVPRVPFGHHVHSPPSEETDALRFEARKLALLYFKLKPELFDQVRQLESRRLFGKYNSGVRVSKK